MAPPHTQPQQQREKGVVYRANTKDGKLERWSGKSHRVSKKADKPAKGKSAKPKKYRHPLLDPQYRLKIGIDHGTKNSSACYIVRDESKPSTNGYDMKSLDTALASQFDFNISSRVAIIKDPNSTTGKGWKLAFDPEIREYENQILSDEVLVVDLLKMALVDLHSSVWNSEDGASMLTKIMKSHQKALKGLHSLVGGKFEINVYSALDNSVRVCAVDNLAVLTQEFLKHMKDNIQKSVMARHSLTMEEGNFVFKDKTDVAFSVPTSWQDIDIDNIRVALNDAGYPETTTILSEAKNSALFKVVWELTDHGTRVQSHDIQRQKAEEFAKKWQDTILILVDIGHGTTDLASIEIIGTWPFIRVSEVVPGTGSACGAYRLNLAFKIHVQQHHAKMLKELSKKHDVSVAAVLESLAIGFEETKCQFDNSQSEFSVAYRLPFDGGQSTVERRFPLTWQEMAGFFIAWETEISDLLFK